MTNYDFVTFDFVTLRLLAFQGGPEMEERYKEHFRTIAKAKGIKEYDVVLDRNSRKYSLKVVPLR